MTIFPFRSGLWCLALIVSVECAPYLLISSTRPKCVKVQGDKGMMVTIKYHAIDMVMPIMPHENLNNTLGPPEAKDEIATPTKFTDAYRKRVEIMQKAGRTVNDISFMVTQRNDDRDGHPWKRRRNIGDHMLDRQSSGRIREEAESPKGSITFYTGGTDGFVEVCVQSMSAHSEAPSRVSLDISTKPTDDGQLNEFGFDYKRKLDTSSGSADKFQVKRQVSRISADLGGMLRKLATITHTANHAKEQEIEFHNLSLAMNRASQYWPIIHLVVLLITGFTQAVHIVNFFKSRRIF